MSYRIYLAGPINGCSDEEALAWRREAHEWSADKPGVFLFDPMRDERDERGREDSEFREIVNQDKTDINLCQALLAVCWKPSVGTSMEIMYAHQRGTKDIVVVVPEGRPVSPWYRAHAQRVFTDHIAALEHLYARSFG